MMRRVYILFAIMLFGGGTCVLAGAQERKSDKGQIQAMDSLAVEQRAVVDSTLLGCSIFSILGSSGDVVINQSTNVEYAFGKYVEANAKKKLNGYRIRIFFDNKQTARVQSEEIEKTFIENYPQYPVYRTYTNPYFKVAVGDFRTKSDAAKVLAEIQNQFPKAFIIKDAINYPL